ncbi:xylan 1,4-beta-xylosidase [Micromonospora echinospora]|uniref:Xylan 1,4-beta-xylosidase n=1 Tax=Micromonospora echinospora TaxID=1877 RepID=A0A1C4ZXM4_MICEC|nr:xylan 1,4-beta-xylosidase [Micromonospora echinospora]OZV83896.1 xylan 1,4-beta-xylosidase [Micromonospora echinospora]SCF37703.1 xylan 1,4-beta-xylosidase [Micromonospora echinospora]
MRIHVPDQPTGRLGDAWRACVGTGRFELALRRDHQDSLALAQREIGFRHIRGHGLLSDGVGVHRPYEYRGTRHVRHAFTYVDQVIDAWLALGVRPFLELGFMPSGLASGDQTVFWWRGNVTPPRSWREWADLVRATLTHLVDRYGLDEVRGWPIEVWNEPNLTAFWRDADRDAYHRLYEVTAHTVKEVDAGLRVGGPAISPGADEWLPAFAEFTADRAVPVDFVSRHAYTSGPARHVPFGTHQTLAPAASLLEQFAAPRRHLAGTALAGLPVHVTEFNSSYRPDNAVHDTAFHAAYLAPVLAAGGDLVDSFSYWTFSDVFEEVGVPTALFHGGFGLLTHRQVKKPAYHLYAFLARMGEHVLARGVDHLVTRDDTGRVTVLAWAPVDVTGRDPVDRHRLALSVPLGPPGDRSASPPGTGSPPRSAFLLRSSVSEEAGNAWRAWCELGRPHSPGPRQLDLLREAAEPGRTHRSVPVVAGRVDLDLDLSRHEVTLVELVPVRDETPPWWHDHARPGGEQGPPVTAFCRTGDPCYHPGGGAEERK